MKKYIIPLLFIGFFVTGDTTMAAGGGSCWRMNIMWMWQDNGATCHIFSDRGYNANVLNNAPLTCEELACGLKKDPIRTSSVVSSSNGGGGNSNSDNNSAGVSAYAAASPSGSTGGASVSSGAAVSPAARPSIPPRRATAPALGSRAAATFRAAQAIAGSRIAPSAAATRAAAPSAVGASPSSFTAPSAGAFNSSYADYADIMRSSVSPSGLSAPAASGVAIIGGVNLSYACHNQPISPTPGGYGNQRSASVIVTAYIPQITGVQAANASFAWSGIGMTYLPSSVSGMIARFSASYGQPSATVTVTDNRSRASATATGMLRRPIHCPVVLTSDPCREKSEGECRESENTCALIDGPSIGAKICYSPQYLCQGNTPDSCSGYTVNGDRICTRDEENNSCNAKNARG